MPREACEAEGSGMVLALGVATRQEDQFLSRVVGECRSVKNDIMYIIGVRRVGWIDSKMALPLGGGSALNADDCISSFTAVCCPRTV